jgi:hypothetical protein
MCVLFGGEINWTVTGSRDLKHLSERVKKHEASAAHIENDVKFNVFSSVNILSELMRAIVYPFSATVSL